MRSNDRRRKCIFRILIHRITNHGHSGLEYTEHARYLNNITGGAVVLKNCAAGN